MDEAARSKHRQDSREETLGRVILSNVLSLAKIVFVCIILVYFTFNYGVRPIRMNGNSMMPTLLDHEYAFSNAFAGHFLSIRRGDIVVAYEKTTKHDNVIKRVIGLPGETIYAKNDKVYVNGVELQEPYLDNDFSYEIRSSDLQFTRDFGPVTLDEDEYWLMGDNRWVSKDSIDFGAFKRDDIKGKGAAVFIPFKNMRIAE